MSLDQCVIEEWELNMLKLTADQFKKVFEKRYEAASTALEVNVFDFKD